MDVQVLKEQVSELLEGTGVRATISQIPRQEVIIDFWGNSTEHESRMDGMQIISINGVYEVSEYQAGPKQDELHIYLETKSLKRAISNALKGNRRKPKKVWR